MRKLFVLFALIVIAFSVMTGIAAADECNCVKAALLYSMDYCKKDCRGEEGWTPYLYYTGSFEREYIVIEVY